MEHVVYDDSGQLLAGSLMDYALPRADHFPGFQISTRNTACANNALGIKGSGEAGAIGAPQAVISAICDALDIPFTKDMLSWQKGGIQEDGIWAQYWYENVHNSTGFRVQKSSNQEMPDNLQSVLDQALIHYTILKNHILKND